MNNENNKLNTFLNLIDQKILNGLKGDSESDEIETFFELRSLVLERIAEIQKSESKKRFWSDYRKDSS